MRDVFVEEVIGEVRSHSRSDKLGESSKALLISFVLSNPDLVGIPSPSDIL